MHCWENEDVHEAEVGHHHDVGREDTHRRAVDEVALHHDADHALRVVAVARAVHVVDVVRAHRAHARDVIRLDDIHDDAVRHGENGDHEAEPCDERHLRRVSEGLRMGRRKEGTECSEHRVQRINALGASRPCGVVQWGMAREGTHLAVRSVIVRHLLEARSRGRYLSELGTEMIRARCVMEEYLSDVHVVVVNSRMVRGATSAVVA